MSSKKRISTTDVSVFAGSSKKSMNRETEMQMNEYRRRKFVLSDIPHTQIITEKQARITKIIDCLVTDRPILYVSTNGKTYTMDRYIADSPTSVSLSSVIDFGKKITDSIAMSGVSGTKYLRENTENGVINYTYASAKHRLNAYRFLRQYPKFTATHISYGYLIKHMAVIKKLFGYVKKYPYESTNNRYVAWCNGRISVKELRKILTR